MSSSSMPLTSSSVSATSTFQYIAGVNANQSHTHATPITHPRYTVRVLNQESILILPYLLPFPVPALPHVKPVQVTATANTEVKKKNNSLTKEQLIEFQYLLKSLPLKSNIFTKGPQQHLLLPENIPSKPCRTVFMETPHVVLPVAINGKILSAFIVSIAKGKPFLQVWNSFLYNPNDHTLQISEIRNKYLGRHTFIDNFFNLFAEHVIDIKRDNGKHDFVRLASEDFINKCKKIRLAAIGQNLSKLNPEALPFVSISDLKTSLPAEPPKAA